MSQGSTSAARASGSADQPAWETFPHGSDVGVRGFGADAAEAFANAAMALTSAIVDPALVRPLRRVAISLAGDDMEILFLDWLNAIVSRMAIEGLLFGRYEVAIHEGVLEGAAVGEPVDPVRHRPAVEVKGATLTELKVEAPPEGGRWLAQCVVDV